MKRGRESALCVDGALMVKEGFAGLFILGGMPYFKASWGVNGTVQWKTGNS